MKKLLGSAVVAMIAFCALGEAQFYEMNITAKTTLTKSGKVKIVACDCRTDTNTLYRKQGSVKIKGAIWGCDCGTLNKGEPYTTSTAPFGYFFWNETTKKPLNVQLEFVVCNRIDSSAKKAEVVWVLSSEDGTFHLTGSGFGAIKDVASKDPCMLVNSWFQSLSGNFAGWMEPGAVVTTKATDGVCTWCTKVEGTPEETAVAKGFGVCADCSACTEMTGSAATGSWTIKFNKKAAQALQGSTSVKDAYKFPTYVSAVMD